MGFTCDFMLIHNGRPKVISWEEAQGPNAPTPDQGVYIPVMDDNHVVAILSLIQKGRKPIEVLASARVALDLRLLRKM